MRTRSHKNFVNLRALRIFVFQRVYPLTFLCDAVILVQKGREALLITSKHLDANNAVFPHPANSTQNLIFSCRRK